MKKRLFVLSASVFFTTALFAKARPELVSTMQQMFTSLLNLQPFLVNPEKFRNAKNRETIQKDLNQLAKLKHFFPKNMKNEEPGLYAISQMFHGYMEDARDRFKAGDYDYARHRMRTVTAFCFSCHSRIPSEKNFEDLQRRVESSQLTSFEKADVFAATRQFDKALKTYTDILSAGPTNGLGIVEFTRSLRRALSITVRVKQNPKETLELLENIGKRKDLPEFVQRMVQQWKKDAQFWMEEKEDTKKLSGEDLIKKAQVLIERASSLQAFPADENGDISFLRASNYLHEALDNNPGTQLRGEALYLLGVAYSALQDPTVWDLDRLYFESCVREAPHSDLAKKCYRRYSDKIYMGYTGSAGTFVPEDELKRLEELRKLAEAKS